MASLLRLLFLLLNIHLFSSETDGLLYSQMTTFPLGTASGSHYVKLRTTLSKQLNEYTLCFWARPHNVTDKTVMTVLSYAVPKRDDEILIGLLMGEGVFFKQIPKQEKNVLIKAKAEIQLGRWIHVCSVWSSYSGRYVTYVNGKAALTLEGVNARQTIDTGGIFILGQDQDVFGGKFKPNAHFQGDLSEVHIWDFEFCAGEVLSLYECNFTQVEREGNLLSWTNSHKVFFSGVEMSPVRLPCGQC